MLQDLTKKKYRKKFAPYKINLRKLTFLPVTQKRKEEKTRGSGFEDNDTDTEAVIRAIHKVLFVY